MHEHATTTAGVVDTAIRVAENVFKTLNALWKHGEKVRGGVVTDAEVFLGDAKVLGDFRTVRGEGDDVRDGVGFQDMRGFGGGEAVGGVSVGIKRRERAGRGGRRENRLAEVEVGVYLVELVRGSSGTRHGGVGG